jgi:hypothetical protein
MRLRWLVIGGVVGAVLGAAAAHVGANRMFICREPEYFDAVCAGGFPILAVAWGVTIGLVMGLLISLLISRRLASNGKTTDPSPEPTM